MNNTLVKNFEILKSFGTAKYRFKTCLFSISNLVPPIYQFSKKYSDNKTLEIT